MKKFGLLTIIFILLLSCEVSSVDSEDYTLDTTDWDWTEDTHSNNVEPNYDIVFPGESDGTDATVLEIHLSFDYDDWYEMQHDISENIDKVNNDDYDYTPVWVPCSVFYDYEDDGVEDLTEWYKVGIRYKGNSSLQTAYNDGNNKLSFKLDFDEFEDDYTEIEDQRFFGFKQLNLNNNFDDESFLRESVASDLFREFGLISSETSFCVVYLDNGQDDEQYYGIYTIVEEVDDTVVETQLDENFMGNLYKPDGDSAQFSGNYTWDEEEMEVKNEGEDVYEDTYSLYTLMANYDDYDTKSEWMTELEAVLDVDTFLKWYAANTVMQNWDTYGNMSHNYYLYNYADSSEGTSLLTWIPWDNNEAFLDGNGEKDPVNLGYGSDVDDDEWPLIGYILDQSSYQIIYDGYVEDFISSTNSAIGSVVKDLYFDSDLLESLYTKYETLLEDWADLEETGYTFLDRDSDFSSAINTMITFADDRVDEVETYLGL